MKCPMNHDICPICRKVNINEYIFKRKSISEIDLTQLDTVAHNCELLKELSDVCLFCISSIHVHNTLLCQCAMSKSKL